MKFRLPVFTSLVWILLTIFTSFAVADISGTVLDPHGQPVGGAEVHLLGGVSARATRTDNSGHFRFPAAPDGAYTLLASAPGLSGAPQKISVTGGTATADLRLALAARSEVVMVTAERAEMPASSVASSATVLTRQQLEEMHAEKVAEALRHVPGLALVQNGGRGGVTSLFARGGNSNFNLVMIDGVKINDFGGGFNFANLPIEGVERIEVVRGPQSALYGLNAIGSVIHIITRRPAGPLAARGAIEGGSFGTVRGSLGAGGRQGRFGWNFDLMRHSTDGVVANDNYRNEAGSLRLEYGLTPTTQLRYTLSANANAAGAPGPFGIAPVDRVTRGKENSYVNGLELETQRGRIRQRLTGSFYTDRLAYESPFGPWRTRQARASVGSETQISLAEGDVLAAGFEYQREGFRNTYITDERASDFPLLRNNLGWFAENRYQTGGRLFLNTGLRLENIRTSSLPADAWGTRPKIAGRDSLALSPKLSVAFLPRPGGPTKFHASTGTGLRAPNGFELGFTDNPRLQPERTTSFDAGIEREFAARRAVVDLTYFHNRYHDLIVTLSGSVAALSRFQSDNLANSRAQGLEVSGALRPVEWMSLNGHYTWLKSEVLSLDRAPGRALGPLHPGQSLLRRPEHSAAWLAAWHVRRLRLRMNTGAVMRSAVLDVDPLRGLGGGVFHNPGYVRADLGAEVALSREVALYGRLYNFSDDRYEEALGYPALRRSFVAGLKFRWR
jgi:outer membrane cobalamin receptor